MGIIKKAGLIKVTAVTKRNYSATDSDILLAHNTLVLPRRNPHNNNNSHETTICSTQNAFQWFINVEHEKRLLYSLYPKRRFLIKKCGIYVMTKDIQELSQNQ